MKLKKGEKYVLNKPLSIRTAYSIAHIPAGETIEIQQVDSKGRNYLVDSTWIHWSRVENAVGGEDA